MTKGLSVTFTMKDRKKFEILQKTVSDNAAFAAKYAPGATDNRTSVLAFAADLCRQLDERGVRHVVSHSERAIRFYQSNYPEQWVFVKELIRYEKSVPRMTKQSLPEQKPKPRPGTNPVKDQRRYNPESRPPWAAFLHPCHISGAGAIQWGCTAARDGRGNGHGAGSLAALRVERTNSIPPATTVRACGRGNASCRPNRSACISFPAPCHDRPTPACVGDGSVRCADGTGNRAVGDRGDSPAGRGGMSR